MANIILGNHKQTGGNSHIGNPTINHTVSFVHINIKIDLWCGF